MPGLSAFRPSTYTTPLIMTAWARWRLSSSPRSTRSRSSLILPLMARLLHRRGHGGGVQAKPLLQLRDAALRGEGPAQVL